MLIAVSGINGFVGSHAAKFFRNAGYKVKGIPREYLYNEEILLQHLEGVDAILHTSGYPITKYWTPNNKKKIFDSRFVTSMNIAKCIERMDNPPKLVISTSATGIYNNIHYHDEYSSDFADNFLGKVCKAWEKPFIKLDNDKTRVVIARLGVVIGYGGIFKKMLPLFKIGLGAKIGHGRYPMPFIHIDDLLKFYGMTLKNQNIKGTYNIVAPDIITNAEFTNAMAKVVNKKAFFRIPPFILDLLFGKGLMRIINNPIVIPKRLLEIDFKYEKDQIVDALIASLNEKNKTKF